MRLHTLLTAHSVQQILTRQQQAGKITGDVQFVQFDQHGSRTHPRSFDIQLGTYDKHSLPGNYTDQHGNRMRVRRFKNTGSYGASSGWAGEQVWAATWDEWGWLIAAIFTGDPSARFGWYASPADFHGKTGSRFMTDPYQPPQGRAATP